MRKSWAVALSLTCVILGASADQALALCKQGGKNCTPLSRNHPVRLKNTLGNVGNCVGSTNETCGYKTHAMSRHSTVNWRSTMTKHK